MKSRETEQLSAYLDGRLGVAESTRLEARLASQPDLRATLEDLRLARRLLGRMPRRVAPRNFALSAQMAEFRAPLPAAVPVLRYASVLASALLIATFAFNGLAPRAAGFPAAASVPLAEGGREGGTPTVEQPLESLAAAAPTAVLNAAPVISPQDQVAPTGAAPAGAAPKFAPPSAGAQAASGTQRATRVPALWQLFLGIAAVAFGYGSWDLQRKSCRGIGVRPQAK